MQKDLYYHLFKFRPVPQGFKDPTGPLVGLLLVYFLVCLFMVFLLVYLLVCHLKNSLQSALYVLHFAAKADECVKTKEGTLFLGYGLNDIYKNLYQKMEYDYEEIKTLYKEKKYDDVIERVEKMLKYLDNFYLVYSH